MTLQEALAIARDAKPLRRASLDKLQGSTTEAKLSTGVAQLSKRYDAMGGTVADMQKQLAQIEVGLARVEDHFNPSQPPLPQGYLN
jgi:capsule polysaccharide export protein KpsE/RkpR